MWAFSAGMPVAAQYPFMSPWRRKREMPWSLERPVKVSHCLLKKVARPSAPVTRALGELLTVARPQPVKKSAGTMAGFCCHAPEVRIYTVDQYGLIVTHTNESSIVPSFNACYKGEVRRTQAHPNITGRLDRLPES
jgi:hypothetical protein